MATIPKSDYRQEMISAAVVYCAASEHLKLSTLGRFIVNDGKFFDRIKNGGKCTFDTYEKVMQWFRDNPPPKTNGQKRKINGSS